jgi:hypothetical protein
LCFSVTDEYRRYAGHRWRGLFSSRLISTDIAIVINELHIEVFIILSSDVLLKRDLFLVIQHIPGDNPGEASRMACFLKGRVEIRVAMACVGL